MIVFVYLRSGGGGVFAVVAPDDAAAVYGGGGVAVVVGRCLYVFVPPIPDFSFTPFSMFSDAIAGVIDRRFASPHWNVFSS